MLKKSIPVVLLMLSSVLAWAQPDPLVSDFEEPTRRSSMEDPNCPIDPNASAYYVYDLQRTDFEPSERAFDLLFHRKFRIQIVKPEGADAYGQITIPYWSGIQWFKDIVGGTYALNEDGQMDFFTLTEDAISQTKVFDDYHVLTIIFPKVKAGSLVELSYTLVSSSAGQMEDWTAQGDIPKLYSRYVTEIPAFYNYNIISRGNLNLTKQFQQVNPKEYYYRGIYSYYFVTMDFETKDIPAFQREPFMPAKNNMLAGIDFEFSNMEIPDRITSDGMKTWESFAEVITSSGNWNEVYGKYRPMKRLLPDSTQALDGLRKARAVYHWVQSTVPWNGELGTMPMYPARKFDGTMPGNIADVNLALCNALLAADLEAYPVMASSSAHGLITNSKPVRGDYNCVLVELVLDGKSYFLSAHLKGLPFGILPDWAYNSYAVRIAKRPKLVDLWEDQISQWKYTGTVEFDPESEKFESNWSVRQESIARGVAFGKETLEEDWSLTEVSDVATVQGYRPEDPTLKVFSATYPADGSEDRWYLPVMVDETSMKTDFTSESRQFPIFFYYPHRYDFDITFTIPEGYTLEELPAQVSKMLPQRAGMFFFMTKQEGDQVVVQSSLRLNEPLLSAEAYPMIKDLFQAMVDAHSEMIIFTKAD